MSPQRTCKICFSLLLALGILWTAIGLLVIPALPYVQLDAVLTMEELRDSAKREATLKLLQKAQGNESPFWTAAGLLVAGISVTGLKAARGFKPFPEHEK